MTNGKPFNPALAHLIGPVFPPKLGAKNKPLGLKVVSTPNKVTMAFDKAITYVALEPNSARRLAGVIVQAADEADRKAEEQKKAEEEKDGTSVDDKGGTGKAGADGGESGEGGDRDS